MVNQSKVMVEPLERPLKDSDFEATHSRPPWVPRVDKRGDPVPWELFRYFIDPKKYKGEHAPLPETDEKTGERIYYMYSASGFFGGRRYTCLDAREEERETSIFGCGFEGHISGECMFKMILFGENFGNGMVVFETRVKTHPTWVHLVKSVYYYPSVLDGFLKFHTKPGRRPIEGASMPFHFKERVARGKGFEEMQKRFGPAVELNENEEALARRQDRHRVKEIAFTAFKRLGILCDEIGERIEDFLNDDREFVETAVSYCANKLEEWERIELTPLSWFDLMDPVCGPKIALLLAKYIGVDEVCKEIRELVEKNEPEFACETLPSWSKYPFPLAPHLSLETHAVPLNEAVPKRKMSDFDLGLRAKDMEGEIEGIGKCLGERVGYSDQFGRDCTEHLSNEDQKKFEQVLDLYKGKAAIDPIRFLRTIMDVFENRDIAVKIAYFFRMDEMHMALREWMMRFLPEGGILEKAAPTWDHIPYVSPRQPEIEKAIVRKEKIVDPAIVYYNGCRDMTIKRAEWVDVRFDHIKGILLPTDVEDIRRAVKFLVNRWQFGDFRIDTFFDSLADRDRFYYSTAVKVSALLGLQEMDLNFEKIIKAYSEIRPLFDGIPPNWVHFPFPEKPEAVYKAQLAWRNREEWEYDDNLTSVGQGSTPATTTPLGEMNESVRPCAIQRMVYLKYNNLDELWYLHERQEYRQAVRNLDTLFAGCKFDFGKFVKTIATLLGKKLGLKLCVFLGLDKFEGIPISEVLAEEAKKRRVHESFPNPIPKWTLFPFPFWDDSFLHDEEAKFDAVIRSRVEYIVGNWSTVEWCIQEHERDEFHNELVLFMTKFEHFVMTPKHFWNFLQEERGVRVDLQVKLSLALGLDEMHPSFARETENYNYDAAFLCNLPDWKLILPHPFDFSKPLPPKSPSLLGSRPNSVNGAAQSITKGPEAPKIPQNGFFSPESPEKRPEDPNQGPQTEIVPVKESESPGSPPPPSTSPKSPRRTEDSIESLRENIEIGLGLERTATPMDTSEIIPESTSSELDSPPTTTRQGGNKQVHDVIELDDSEDEIEYVESVTNSIPIEPQKKSKKRPIAKCFDPNTVEGQKRLHEKNFWEVGADWARRSVASRDREGFEEALKETHYFYESNAEINGVELLNMLSPKVGGGFAARFLCRYQFYVHDDELRKRFPNTLKNELKDTAAPVAKRRKLGKPERVPKREVKEEEEDVKPEMPLHELEDDEPKKHGCGKPGHASWA